VGFVRVERLIASSTSRKHFAMRSEGVNAIPLHCRPQSRPANRFDHDVDLHASKTFLEECLDTAKIEKIQSPVRGRCRDHVDITSGACRIACDRIKYADASDPPSLKLRAHQSQDLDGRGAIHKFKLSTILRRRRCRRRPLCTMIVACWLYRTPPRRRTTEPTGRYEATAVPSSVGPLGRRRFRPFFASGSASIGASCSYGRRRLTGLVAIRRGACDLLGGYSRPRGASLYRDEELVGLGVQQGRTVARLPTT
jgi:hypothetical protein